MHPNENYVNETWPGNNLEPGTSSNSVPSLWTCASQDRLLENQECSNSMYPISAVPGEHYHLIEDQHLNSAYSEGAGPSEEFYLIDNVQANPERAVPGEFYLFANQQFSSMYPVQGEQNFHNIDNGQVDDSVNPEVAVTGEWYPIHDLQYREDELQDCNHQIAQIEFAEFQRSYDVWPSQAGGLGEGASSSASLFSCQTVCSTPEPEALHSPIATDPSTAKSWLRPAEHRSTSSEVATSDYEGERKKKKARKWQCEVRISKKLRKSADMNRDKLWITFDRAEEADRAKRVSNFLLSGSKKYVDTQFDPEFKPGLKALRAAVQENGLDSNTFCKVKDLAEWYGKHGAT